MTKKSVSIFLDLDLPVIGGKQQLTAKEGAYFTLSCFAEGYPKVRYQWNFNGQFAQNGSTLFIQYAKKQDSGNYSCVAINELEKIESSPTLLNVTGESMYIYLKVIKVYLMMDD